MDIHTTFGRFMIVTIVTVSPVIGYADADLTPEQLVLLMQASSQHYSSLDARIKTIYYQHDPDNTTEPIPAMTEEVVSRWTREKVFLRIVRTVHLSDVPEDYPRVTTTTYCGTPKQSKYLVEAPDGRIPRGTIRSPRLLGESLPALGVYEAMWDMFFAWSVDQLNLAEATVEYQQKDNCYVMTVATDNRSRTIVLHIDPSKCFIPIKREFLFLDGSPLITIELSEFRQTKEGLWVPYRFHGLGRPGDYEAVSEIQELRVNEPIAEHLLDFSFPDGTIVHDEMRGLKYTVEGVDEGPADKAQARSETTTDIALTAPVKEEQLRAAASKAEQMLQTLTAEQALPPAIQVWPTIVLVTNDKYEYRLSLTKSDRTELVLSDYEFESRGVELSSFKNLIDDQNQLVLSINRKKSDTSFASGTLLLQFKGHDGVTKVTFVSAPLQDTP